MKELSTLLELLDITPRAVNDDFITLDGVNGQVSIIYKYIGTSKKEAHKYYVFKIKKHLIQMGKDSLKIELNNLLDITKHL